MTRRDETARGSAPSRAHILRDAARQAEARGGSVSNPDVGERGALSALQAWESDQRERTRRKLLMAWARVRNPARIGIMASVAFLLGLQLAARPDGARLAGLENEADRSRTMLQARHGELELIRLELNRLQEVLAYSERYRIPADLASDIKDIALSEGIAPELAFSLVRVESGFHRRAISPVGAVGYAQLMPPTAFELDPTIQYRDLFDREINLRLGFRYLRQMIDRYDGDLRLALLAYNRGPGRVDSILRAGGDPSNGYEDAVLGGIARR